MKQDLIKGLDGRHILFGMFFAFQNRLQAAGDAFYEEITCKQFFMLICLKLFGSNAPTINELSEVMGSTHQNVKQIAVKLEKSGLVRISTDEQDKRKLRILTTDKLAQFADKYEAREQEFLDRFYRGISDVEIEAVSLVIAKLEQNLLEIYQENK